MIIKNGAAAFSGQEDFLKHDLRLKDGKIVEIGESLQPNSDEEILDADGLLIFPGGVDPHVHFYDPGYTQKEDFYHGTAAAASGGITTVIDMPCTSLPPVTDLESFNHKLNIVQPKACIDFGFFGGVSRQLFDSGCFESMRSIADKVFGFKVYSVSGMEEVWGALDHWRFSRVLEMGRELNTRILLHAEDREYVDNSSAHFRSQGKDARLWYNARPELAEILAVKSAVLINREVGGDLHIVHVGTGEASRIIGREKQRILAEKDDCRITGETCPQYLAFGLEDFCSMGPVLKIAPPVKKEHNRKELLESLVSGQLDFIASDHAPGTAEEKGTGDIWCNSAGIAGTGTMFPYLLSEGYFGGNFTLKRFLKVMCENSPKKYGFFNRKGSLEPGKDADLVFVHPKKSWTVKGDEFLSKGKLTPFEGMTFKGKIMQTMVRGKTVYSNGQISADSRGWGRNLTP